MARFGGVAGQAYPSSYGPNWKSISMARMAPVGLWSQARARGLALAGRNLHAVAAALLLLFRRVIGSGFRPARVGWLAAVLIGIMASTACRADVVRGEATLTPADGYARLVLKFAEDVNAEVTTAGSILLIRFDRPANIPIDRWTEAAPDYISSARGDPDGSALRLSLSRKLKVNTMVAGERVFIDLLPDTWTGPPPSLPQEVVRELAERARAAERALRLQRTEAETRKRPPVRVRALVQPTFVRFVFEMPDGVNVSSVLNEQKLLLTFNAPLNFDLADAKLAAPPNVGSIMQKMDVSTSKIEMNIIGEVDVHTFREEKNYNIDVAFQQPDKPKMATLPMIEATPAAKPMAAEKPKPAAQAAEIIPPTSESIAREMKPDRKAAAETPAPQPPTAPAMAEQPAKGRMEGREGQIAAQAPAPQPKAEMAAPEAAKSDVAKVEPAKVESAKVEPAKVETAKVETPKPEEPKMAPAKPETAKPIASEAAGAPAGSRAADGSVVVEAVRDSEGLRLSFGFGQVTPAALFRRGDTVWLVFDSTRPIDVEPIRAKGGAIVGEVNRQPLPKGQAIRIRLNRPQMHSLSSDDGEGRSWTLSFADKGQNSQQPLMVMRNVTDPALANVAVPLANPGPACCIGWWIPMSAIRCWW